MSGGGAYISLQAGFGVPQGGNKRMMENRLRLGIVFHDDGNEGWEAWVEELLRPTLPRERNPLNRVGMPASYRQVLSIHQWPTWPNRQRVTRPAIEREHWD
jgi:hypothetical protein